MSSSEAHPGTDKETAISEVASRIATAAGNHIVRAMAAGNIKQGDEARVIGRAIEEMRSMAAHVLDGAGAAVPTFEEGYTGFRAEDQPSSSQPNGDYLVNN